MPYRHVAGLSKIKFEVTCCLIFTPVTMVVTMRTNCINKTQCHPKHQGVIRYIPKMLQELQATPLHDSPCYCEWSLLHQTWGASPYLRHFCMKVGDINLFFIFTHSGIPVFQELSVHSGQMSTGTNCLHSWEVNTAAIVCGYSNILSICSQEVSLDSNCPLREI